MNNDIEKKPDNSDASEEARREFLKKLGKYAVVAPPTIVALMANRKAKAIGSQFPD